MTGRSAHEALATGEAKGRPIFVLDAGGATVPVFEVNGTFVVAHPTGAVQVDSLVALRAHLVRSGLLDGESHHLVEKLATGTWSVETLVGFLPPDYTDGSIEYCIDGIEFCGDYPLDADEAPEWTLESSAWELGPVGGGSPGIDASGSDTLVRFRGRYLLFSRGGGEVDVTELTFADDATAIAWFHAMYPGALAE